MKSNKDIFNEAFFKKETYSDKMKKKLPQYNPVSIDRSGAVVNSTFDVSDPREARERLAGTFGVTFGNNNIKSMASRALKTFPILVSDAVEPDTVVMLKRLFEEQYAQYINLLVSNQVVDLSQYDPTDPSGNIAMQALDSLSGTDFSSTRIANKAANTGKVNSDDVFKNIAIAQLLKENQKVETGDALVDAILENALVISDEDVKTLVEYMNNHGEEFAELLDEEAHSHDDYDNPKYTDSDDKNKSLKVPFAKYIQDLTNGGSINSDNLKNLMGKESDDVYSRLTNTSMVVDRKSMDKALDRTVGEILCDSSNAIIRDRFEKAVFLLESSRISGKEFIAYVTIRLGLPISKDVRKELIQLQVKVKPDKNNNDPLSPELTKRDKSLIDKNKIIVEKGVKGIYATKLRTIVVAASAVAAGAGTGAIVGAVNAGALSGIGGWLTGLITALGAAGPFVLPVIAGSAVGASAFAITKLISSIKKKVDAANAKKNVTGWERVEALINEMDRQRADVIANYNTINRKMDTSFNMSNGKVSSAIYSELKNSPKGADPRSIMKPDMKVNDDNDDNAYVTTLQTELDELKARLDKLSKSAILTEEFQNPDDLMFRIDEDVMAAGLQGAKEALDECLADKELMADLLNEASLAAPLVKTRFSDTDPNAVLLPGWAASSNYAYGSAEIDNRVVKDRRYDQPLIMTIKFNSRMSDGRTTDNQLTAVIGILGRVIRIPSEEMKYILEANIEGETIRGLFDGGNVKNLVSDLLSTSKISKDVKGLPQSIDVWKNLEKVATLAAANKLAGKRTNNVANAHIIFSQKEIDDTRTETGVDYFRQMKLVASLMKRYSAFTLMVANDPGQKLYSYDDLDAISWNVVPYSALMKDNGNDQLTSALARLGRI